MLVTFSVIILKLNLGLLEFVPNSHLSFKTCLDSDWWIYILAECLTLLKLWRMTWKVTLSGKIKRLLSSCKHGAHVPVLVDLSPDIWLNACIVINCRKFTAVIDEHGPLTSADPLLLSLFVSLTSPERKLILRSGSMDKFLRSCSEVFTLDTCTNEFSLVPM